MWLCDSSCGQSKLLWKLEPSHSYFSLVKSFVNIDWGDVSALIFHSSTDSDLDIMKELTSLKEKVEKVIYINSNVRNMQVSAFLACVLSVRVDVHESQTTDSIN